MKESRGQNRTHVGHPPGNVLCCLNGRTRKLRRLAAGSPRFRDTTLPVLSLPLTLQQLEHYDFILQNHNFLQPTQTTGDYRKLGQRYQHGLEAWWVLEDRGPWQYCMRKPKRLEGDQNWRPKIKRVLLHQPDKGASHTSRSPDTRPIDIQGNCPQHRSRRSRLVSHWRRPFINRV